jgi:hypothetical protein
MALAHQPVKRWTWRKDGEFFSVPRTMSFRLGCCDCGLVHRVRVKVRRDGRIVMGTVRDDGATDQVRRRFSKRFPLKARRNR